VSQLLSHGFIEGYPLDIQTTIGTCPPMVFNPTLLQMFAPGKPIDEKVGLRRRAKGSTHMSTGWAGV
jgi:hypothetical protein